MDARPNGSADSRPRTKPVRIGYLIPEFPGQTHIWMWREIEWVRRWADLVHIYSTRIPPERDRARHAFAETAKDLTTYLWPLPDVESVAWALAERPQGLLSCIKLCFSVPLNKRPAFAQTLKLLPSACYLAKDILDKEISHLHVHSCANSALLAMMVKRLTGVGYSLTLNANISWWGGAMKEKFGEADFTIAITEWLLAEMRSDFPELKEDQVLLGRIGVDTSKWKAEPRPQRASDAPFRVVTVGRMHFSKGHDILIRAIHELRSQGRDVTLKLVGDGPQKGELEALAAELGLRDHVTFTGSLAEHQVQEQLRGADAFALASHAEPLGVVYMEAMAAGVPTIGTAAGGVGEIIESGKDGLLVEPKNVSALAAAIARLMDDPELSKRLAEQGRETIVRRFDARIGAATLFTRVAGYAPPESAAAT